MGIYSIYFRLWPSIFGWIKAEHCNEIPEFGINSIKKRALKWSHLKSMIWYIFKYTVVMNRYGMRVSWPVIKSQLMIEPSMLTRINWTILKIIRSYIGPESTENLDLRLREHVGYQNSLDEFCRIKILVEFWIKFP